MSKAGIMARLKAAPQIAAGDSPAWQAGSFDKIANLTRCLEAVHAEVHKVGEDWQEFLRGLLAEKKIGKLLCAQIVPDLPEAVTYSSVLEEFKDDLVNNIDAGLSISYAGIAETGTLVIKGGEKEPRLLSLLPPINIVVLDVALIVNNMGELLAKVGTLPTNLLFISGPSKTADIEQTLAYGVHGPKELIVLIRGE